MSGWGRAACGVTTPAPAPRPSKRIHLRRLRVVLAEPSSQRNLCELPPDAGTV